MSSDVINFNKPCTACRRRKVRCDKSQPCNNCVRHGVSCLYETSRESFVNHQILQERVERLERMVEELATLSLHNSAPNRPQRTYPSDHSPPSGRDDDSDVPTDTGSQIFQPESSYHLGPDHWMNLEHLVYEPRCMLNINSEQSIEDGNSWPLMGHPTKMNPSSQLHLPDHKEDILIKLFFAHVEPFIRIVHQTSVWQMVAEHRSGLSTSTIEVQALMFSIQYITASVLPTTIIQDKVGLPKPALRNHLQRATELALEKADVMRSRNTVCFSALLYYITCKFHLGDGEVASTLLGLAGSIAKRAGMHRDPSFYGYTPWSTEMRRRIWGHLASLDAQSTTLDGCEASMTIPGDVQKATNASDSEWTASYDSREPGPVDHYGFTDNTCALIRREISQTNHRVIEARKSASSCEELISIIRRSEKYISVKFLNHFDGSDPLQHVITHWTRAMIRALHVSVLYYHAHGPRAELRCHEFEKLREQLYLDCLNCLEEFQRGENIATPHHWQWAFRWPMPVHVIAGLLSSLARQPDHPDTERAWEQIDVAFRRYNNDDISMAKTPLWHAIERMCDHAIAQHPRITHAGRSYTRRVVYRGNQDHSSPGSDPLRDLSSMSTDSHSMLEFDVSTPALGQMLMGATGPPVTMHLGGFPGLDYDGLDYFNVETNNDFSPLDI